MKYKLLFLIVMLSLIPLTSSLELYQTPNQVYRNFDTIYISEAVTNNGTSTYIGNGFIGRIDEVALFSEELTEEQISEIYNNGDGLPYGGLGISVILLNLLNIHISSAWFACYHHHPILIFAFLFAFALINL